MQNANERDLPVLAGRPLVGVPTQTLQAIDGIPEGLPHSWVMNDRYLIALATVSAAPVLLPLLDEDTATLRAIYDRLDGLFLAGGVDVDPASYGEACNPLTGRIDPSRDSVELTLTRWALADGMPIFGVCRGLQILNVARGGSLVQDTTALFPGALKHDYFPTQGFARDHLAHDVTPAAGSRIAEACGSRPFAVNSMHHQGVARVGSDLAVTATAPDGLIEALELPGSAFVVGVQWHPEMLLHRDDGTFRLFEAFSLAAADYAAKRAWAGPVSA
jgi:putative glutamine amidotransferase